jgi:subtilisin family serine protease
MELQGKQFVRVDEKWFVESSPDRWFEVVPDVVTVKFNKQTPKASETAILRAHGSSAIRRNRLGAVDIKVPRGLDPVKFVEILQKSGKFEYAEVNTFGRWEVIPDDAQFIDQWGLHNTGLTGGTVDADVDAPEAWDLAVASPTVTVAVLDSGTDYDHEDLECNIWVNPGEDIGGDGIVMDPADINGIDDDGNGLTDDLIGWDFDASDNDPDPTNFHGTHVAGIIGACGDNAIGVIGVAGGLGAGTGAKMMVVLVGNNAPNASILDDSIIYAADNGARVIALSLSVGQSAAIDAALEYAYDTMGVLVVNATGNNDGPVGYPASNTHVLAVGATDDDDLRAESPPLTWGSNFGPEVEVVAPGVDVMSTVLADGYDLASGTSMASPHVSGTAALMFSAAPGATNQQVRDCITVTAEDEVGAPDEDTPGRDDFYGFGRLNTADALTCIAFNSAPTCDANGPYTAECSADTQLDGSGSTDPDGDELSFLWEGPFESSPALGPTPTVVFAAPTGAKLVDLTVSDPFGGTDSCSSPVNVEDTFPPSITPPDDVTEECISPDGTPAELGTAVSDDLCDVDPAISNNAPPLFPLGDTSVLWTATDDSGNQASATQKVTIEDTTPPDLTAPADVTVECTSPDGTPVDLGDPVVSDICDASVDVVNDAPPLFPVGTTPVLWTATDDSGNQSNDGQDVIVEDTTPPTIFCNAPGTITPPDAPITFTVTAEDICDAEPFVEIVEYDCFKVNKKGKRIGKTSSCVVSFEGTEITILDSGGVDDHITWTVEAVDIHGNESSEVCEVVVVNPTD